MKCRCHKLSHCNHVTVFNSVALSTFIVSCNHLHYLIPEHSPRPKQNPYINARSTSTHSHRKGETTRMSINRCKQNADKNGVLTHTPGATLGNTLSARSPKGAVSASVWWAPAVRAVSCFLVEDVWLILDLSHRTSRTNRFSKKPESLSACGSQVLSATKLSFVSMLFKEGFFLNFLLSHWQSPTRDTKWPGSRDQQNTLFLPSTIHTAVSIVASDATSQVTPENTLRDSCVSSCYTCLGCSPITVSLVTRRNASLCDRHQFGR